MVKTIIFYLIFGGGSAFFGFALCAIITASSASERQEEKQTQPRRYKDKQTGKTCEVLHIAENKETGERFVIYQFASDVSPVWAMPANKFYDSEKTRRNEDKSNVTY